MKYLLLCLLFVTYVFAAPAFNKTREFKNSDGTTFTGKANGDRYLNWIETIDGIVLKYNSQSRNFEYAKIDNGRLVSSGVKYEKKSSTRSSSFGDVKRVDLEDVYKLWSIKRKNSHNVK